MNRLNRKGLLAFLEALTCWDEIYLDEHPDTAPLYQSGVYYSIPEQFQKNQPKPEKIYAALRGVGVSDEMARKQAEILLTGENFRDIPSLYARGRGDCDNVSTTRAAELRFCGVDANPFITYKKRLDGGTTIHVVTRWPDNTTEDSSLILGMGGARRAKDRAEALRQLAERRENIANALLAMKAEGRDISDSEVARLAKLVKYLQPPPAAMVAGFDRLTER